MAKSSLGSEVDNSRFWAAQVDSCFSHTVLESVLQVADNKGTNESATARIGSASSEPGSGGLCT